MTDLDRRAALQAERAEALAARLADLLPSLDGSQRALDVGSGLGALAFALAPRVLEVVAVERDAQQVERLLAAAPPNVAALVGDGEHLELESFSFDVAGTLVTLHHTPRPELLVAELVRVTRPGGTLLVVDQLAPVDPLAAVALNTFERARDPSTSRLLSDGDLRGLFDSNGLVLAGCAGPERETARALAPGDYEAEIGWYVLTR